MYILCFHLTKGWKTLFAVDLFSHSLRASPALGFLCGLVIYRSIYHNIHGNCNWITRECAHSRVKERWLTCLAMFTCLFCVASRLCQFAGSDLTESIINSFDCVGRKESLPLRRKAGVQAEQRRTLANWGAGSCRWRVSSHTRRSHGLCLYMCFVAEVSQPPLHYIVQTTQFCSLFLSVWHRFDTTHNV